MPEQLAEWGAPFTLMETTPARFGCGWAEIGFGFDHVKFNICYNA